jgi:hypothetical protein
MNAIYEFTGPVSNLHFQAANAVASAMEELGTLHLTESVAASALSRLGGEWDAEALHTLLYGCSFAISEGEGNEQT